MFADASEISDVYSFVSTDEIFTALSSPVRRRILQILLDRPQSVSSLVDQFDLQRPAVSEHLQVLRNAKLVRDVRQGRERFYHAEPQRLVEVNDWLRPFERYWRKRMRLLNKVLDEESHD